MNIARHLEYAALFFPDRPAVRRRGAFLRQAQRGATASRPAWWHPAWSPVDLLPSARLIRPIGSPSISACSRLAVWPSPSPASFVGRSLKNCRPREAEVHVCRSGTKLQELEGLKTSGEVEWIVAPGGDRHGPPDGEGDGIVQSDGEGPRRQGRHTLYGRHHGLAEGGRCSTHQGITFSAYSIAYYERSTQNDVALCFLPFNHVFGQMHILNSTVFSSGCLELLPTFDMDRVLHILDEGRLTKFLPFPRSISVSSPCRTSESWGRCATASRRGGDGLEIVKRWKELTGITIAESYGMTECMPITFNHYYTGMHARGPWAPGHGVEVQIRGCRGKLDPPGGSSFPRHP